MRTNDQSNRIIKWIVMIGDFVLLNAIILVFAYWHWVMGEPWSDDIKLLKGGCFE